MTTIKSIEMLFYLSYEMLKNKKYLTDNEKENYSLVREICTKFIDKLNVEFNIIGAENIPMEENSLIVSNHKSFFDILVLVLAVNKDIPFASAKELMNYPILKDYISSIGCISIDRETKDVKVMKKQLKDIEDTVLNKGLILFPEGECSYSLDADIKDFKKGGFMAVNKNNLKIVPTYINYSGFKKIGKWILPTEEISIHFGKAFKSSEISDKKITTNILTDYTKKKVLELKNVNKVVAF